MLGIYIHIPFCRRRCNYCDFCSSVSSEERISAYVSALIKSIISFPQSGLSADTVYFGGGTPSLLNERQMSEIMEAVCKKFALSDCCEITSEANPGTVTLPLLKSYRAAGINRISFGIQSCKDNELYMLGRLHTFSDALAAIDFAHSAGIENISADLMLGIPYQTVGTALESVEKFTSSGIKHLSAYMLKIEPGTPFDCDEIRRLIPDDDAVSDMYLCAINSLSQKDFRQYEISNFSLAGFECRHNLKYWTMESYLGFGPSAHSFFNDRRFYISPDIDSFINDPLKQPLIEDDKPDKLSEYIMLGLRLCKGISLDKVSMLGGDADKLRNVCKPFISAGLMHHENGRLYLSPEGFLVSNGIISRII